MGTIREQIWTSIHRLRSWQGLHQVVANTFWLFGQQAIALVVAGLVGVWAARYLGPSRYGDLNFALSFFFLFSPLAILGLDKVLVRELVRNPEDSPRLLGSAFVLRLVSGGVATLVTIGTAVLLWPDDREAHWLIGIVSVGLILGASQVIEAWFSSRVEGKNVVIARVTALLLATGGKIALIVVQAPLVAFAVLVTAETLVNAILLFAIYRWRGFSPAQWVVSGGEAINLVRHAWPILLASIASVVYTRIDQLLLMQMWGPRVVGIYAAAIGFVELSYFFPTAIISSVFPAIICLRQTNSREYQSRMQQLYDFLTWLGVGMALLLNWCSAALIGLLLGPAFEDSAEVLAVSIWSCVFVFPGTAYGHWLYAEDLQLYGLLSVLAVCVLNLLLNLCLIPVHGASGAAIASVVSLGVGTLIAPLLSRKTRPGAWQLLRALAFPVRVCWVLWRR
jgi:PST family polysaccharide transporter